MPIAFIDTETDGLDERVNDIWEIALILRAGGTPGSDVEYHFWLPISLTHASPQALQINHFHERHAQRRAELGSDRFDDPGRVAARIGELTDGAVLAGMNVFFDVRFLTALMRRHQVEPSWFYTPLDIKALIAGRHRVPPPWRSEELSRINGIDPESYARHGALDDARYARDNYDQVYTPAA